MGRRKGTEMRGGGRRSGKKIGSSRDEWGLARIGAGSEFLGKGRACCGECERCRRAKRAKKGRAPAYQEGEERVGGWEEGGKGARGEAVSGWKWVECTLQVSIGHRLEGSRASDVLWASQWMPLWRRSDGGSESRAPAKILECFPRAAQVQTEKCECPNVARQIIMARRKELREGDRRREAA